MYPSGRGVASAAIHIGLGISVSASPISGTLSGDILSPPLRCPRTNLLARYLQRLDLADHLWGEDASFSWDCPP